MDPELQVLITEGQWNIRSDGRTAEGRIVPFREPATVMERGEVYSEQFLEGCLTRMCQIAARRGNAGWIALNVDHDETMDARIGYAAALEQREDGGWCTFRLYPGPHLEKVRSMLEESHRGLSVMFDDLAPPRDVDGVRSRVQIGLRHVAATPLPVYTGAFISAVRDVPGSTAAPDLAELEDRPALREWQDYLAGLHP